MAYSTLDSLEKTIDQILDHGRFSISPREKKQLISLDKCVISFQAFLEDFPEKAKNLESRIRVVAAEAEDIIEWFMLEQIRYGYRYTKWIAILRGIKFRYQLHKVSDAMDSIAKEVAEMKNSIIVKDAQLGDSPGAGLPSQVADTGKSNIDDSNEDLLEIKAWLCGEVPQLQVLPIIGMGGIGKTTLARNAYYDQLIMEHFQIRAWVTISQDYSARRILLDLLDSMKEFDPECRNESMAKDSEQCNSQMAKRSEHGNESPAEISEQSNSKMAERSEQSNKSLAKILEQSNSEMAVKVHKVLAGRRFLIVMDDVWSTEVLDDVKRLFPNYNNGSRIMLTTRLKDVATHANSSIHEMRLMDAAQSWTLLRQKAFIHQDHISREVESAGREIARSCGGLPLAIVVIGGFLSSASKTWEEVSKNIKQSLAATDGQIENILSLSYSHLPPHLRPCFLYMGGFPEDHEIKATDLTRLWIAEGFVKPIVSKRFEDTAEEYLEDLVDRSLIIVTKRKSDRKIKHCSLHDMVREMCIKLSQEEKFLVHVKGGQALGLLKSMTDQRRISISHSDLNSFANIFSSTIRTIMYFQDTLGSFGSFRLLRVLDVLRVRIMKSSLLPDQFFELFHLRYLAFWYPYSIPRAISNLQSLQTLIIGGYDYKCLPCEIWNMRQLRHLICSGKPLADPNGATYALENLQTLGLVEDLECSIRILNMIPNLKKLRLRYTHRHGQLLFDSLVHLRRLEMLYLEKDYASYYSGVVPNLVVPSSLKKLTLKGWGYYKPYLNIVGPFPNLEVLKLKTFNFMLQEWRTSDEDFPQLQFLLIEESNIKQWSAERSHFPRLKSLLIRSCLDLIEIPEGIGEISTLELIELKHCTKSLADSARQIQEEVQSYGDDEFQVRCIDCNKPIRVATLPQPTARFAISYTTTTYHV